MGDVGKGVDEGLLLGGVIYDSNVSSSGGSGGGDVTMGDAMSGNWLGGGEFGGVENNVSGGFVGSSWLPVERSEALDSGRDFRFGKSVYKRKKENKNIIDILRQRSGEDICAPIAS